MSVLSSLEQPGMRQAARQPGSQTAGQPDSQTARQPDSQTARQPDSQAAKQTVNRKTGTGQRDHSAGGETWLRHFAGSLAQYLYY